MLPGQPATEPFEKGRHNWNDAAKSESDKDMSGGPTEVETKKEKKDKKSKVQSGVNEEAAAVDYGPQKQCDHEHSPYSLTVVDVSRKGPMIYGSPLNLINPKPKP